MSLKCPRKKGRVRVVGNKVTFLDILPIVNLIKYIKNSL